MNISVIVPVYNQWHLLSVLIDALSQQSGNFTREFIIVDNDSDFIPELSQHSEITFLRCKKPGSYSARNMGLNYASGELIIFTDADCLPDHDWVEKLWAAYKLSNKKTLLAGNVIIKSNRKKPSCAELYDMTAGLPQQRYVAKGYAVTANLAIPSNVFDQIGTFDDSRFSGGDADFCHRALMAGFSLKFVPNANVYHPARMTWAECVTKVKRMKGGQIRAGERGRRMKFFLITLIPPVWRIWRTVKSEKLKPFEKIRVIWFQIRLWFVELFEMFALLFGKKPERR